VAAGALADAMACALALAVSAGALAAAGTADTEADAEALAARGAPSACAVSVLLQAMSGATVAARRTIAWLFMVGARVRKDRPPEYLQHSPLSRRMAKMPSGLVRRGRSPAGAIALLAAASSVFTATSALAINPQPPPSPTPIAGDIKPAAERSITAVSTKPTASRAPGTNRSSGTPGIRGPKLPEAMRKQLQARLDARVEADIAQMKSLRKEAIELLTKFVAETPREAREMPEALVRLSELEWENERESFVARFQEWEKKPVDQRGPTPELDYRVPRDLLARVLRDYPWFDQYDLALYVDGFLAYEQGKEDEARERFEKILRDYPQSRFVPDAHMAKAEAIFNGKYDYAGALAEYEKVLSYKDRIDPALYGLALFKSAWCHWRLGNNDEAAKRFVGVFEATDVQGGGKNASAAQRKQLDELQEEALNYVVEVFTENESNTAQDLYGFLTKIGGERFSGRIVRRLAQQFYDQSHYERGIEAYELLLKLEPTNREAGEWVLQIAAGYDAIEDWSHLKATFDRALAQYTAGGPWSRTQADPANVAATTAQIEKALREDGRSLHAKAQKDKTSRAEFEGAVGLYDVYLSKFASEPKAYEVQFNVGEIDFFRLQRNLEAATHYLAAARSIPPKETDKDLLAMRHDALYNALVALAREMDARDKKVQGETEADKKYAEALDLYAQFYPNDPQLPAMFYRQGRSYFENANYDSAVKIWGMLLEKFPSSKEAADAGESILESFSRAKNYENIETWARRLKALPSFGAAKQQERLDGLIVQAVFKQGEQKAAAGDHVAAAAAYLRAAKEFPKDTRAAQACVNAEQEAKVGGDAKVLQEAAQLAMGPAYRDRPESPMGGWIATTTLQAMGLFGEAADIAEQMAALGEREHPNYQKFEHEKDAAYNAVILREASGENERAVADGTKFLNAYASAPEADDVVFQMGRAHQNAGRAKDAAELYKRFLSRAKNLDHRAQGLVLLAQVEVKMGDERGAAASLEEAVNLGKRQGKSLGAEGKYAAAHARYMQGERILAKFEQVQIQGDVKQLKGRLKQKAELLKDAAKTFLDCVSMGVAEWTTAALYQIGHMYEAFGKALRDSPPPPDVKTEEQKADYQSQIEEFAVPMEERSLDAYENGWKKAIELGIYNQWTEKMRDALGRLNSELYPPFKETGFEVRSQGPLPLPPLIEAPNRPVGEAAAPAPGKK
jgi:tetratricopeptide (TPR) repeat protein